MSKPVSCAEAALAELCAKYGYCLGEENNQAILSDVPENPDSFVDAVLAAEGFDPALIDKRHRLALREVVCDWLFDDGQGCGAKSGLPRLPQAS
jgi:hypothetical protein